MKNKSAFSLCALSLVVLSAGYSDEISTNDIAWEFQSENGSLTAEEVSAANAETIVPDMMQPPVEVADQREIAWGFRSRKNAFKPKLGAAEESSEDTDSMQASSSSTTLKNYNDITKKGGWINAEFLYWKPSVSGITIGLLTELSSFLENTENPLTQKEHHISYDYHPGFRVGFGCRLPYDHWDLSGQWTQLNVNGRKTLHSTEEKALFISWSTPLGLGFPSSIRAKGNINLRIADLDLGKVFYVSRPFSLRPSIGARGVWIHQGIKLNQLDVSISNGGMVFASGNDHLHLKNHYQAGGLRGALAAQWNFPYGWAFYGKTGISLLWGRFKASLSELFVGEDMMGNPIEQPYDQTNNFNAMKSAYDITAGISWSKVFSQKLRLSFNLGYEFNFFPNQEEIKLYPGGASGEVFPLKQGGDLGFQGLNAGMRIDF